MIARRIAAALAVACIVLAPDTALADSTPDDLPVSRAELDALRQELAQMRQLMGIARAPAPAQPKPRPSRAAAQAALAALAIRHPLAAGAFGLPLLSNVPMFASGFSGGATSFSGLSGTITSAQMIDPYVPVDGTMNVTGAINPSTDIMLGSGRGIFGVSGADRQFQTGSTSTFGAIVRSYTSDGAGNAAVKIAAASDLTAGAFIVSFGDNDTAAYSAKATIGYDGTFTSQGNVSAVNVIGTTSVQLTDTNVQIVESGTNDMDLYADGVVNLRLSSAGTQASVQYRITGDVTSAFCAGNGGTEACFGRSATDDGAEVNSGVAGFGLVTASGSRGVYIVNGQFQHRVVPITVADNGAGSAASQTLTITTDRGSHYEITCNDANGCAMTWAETAPLQGGTVAHVVNLSANNVTFSDSAGVQLVAGATITLGQHDSVEFRYDSDAVWRQSTAVVAVE